MDRPSLTRGNYSEVPEFRGEELKPASDSDGWFVSLWYLAKHTHTCKVTVSFKNFRTRRILIFWLEERARKQRRFATTGRNISCRNPQSKESSESSIWRPVPLMQGLACTLKLLTVTAFLSLLVVNYSSAMATATTRALSRTTARSRTARKLATTIQKTLQTTADPIVKENYERYHKYLIFRGHKMPSLRTVALDAVCEFRGTDKPLATPPELSLPVQNDIFQAAEYLIESSFYDDKLAGISLLTHVLMEHHVRMRKKASKQNEQETVSSFLASTSILADELGRLRRVEQLFDYDHMDAWCLVDNMASGFLRRLAFGSLSHEKEILNELFGWAETEARPLLPSSQASSSSKQKQTEEASSNQDRKLLVYQDQAVWKRRAPLITCVSPANQDQLLFRTALSSSSHPPELETGDLLLQACTHNIKLGQGERFASTGAGWVMRYVLKHRAEIGRSWMEENVEYLTAEGVRYALEQHPCTAEYREDLLSRCIRPSKKKRKTSS